MSLIMVLAMMIMTAFTACSDDDNEGNKTVVFPELANISSAAGETTELSFEASADWELSSNTGWCKFQNGEFLESLIYGKAGKQTVTIMTSADGQNYNEDAVAEITLKMGNASQVIYKVTRAKREYADLVVSDEAGNIYDRTHPLTIKGNTATSPVYTVIKAQAENGVKIGFTNPEWLSYVIDEKEGNVSVYVQYGKHERTESQVSDYRKQLYPDFRYRRRHDRQNGQGAQGGDSRRVRRTATGRYRHQPHVSERAGKRDGRRAVGRYRNSGTDAIDRYRI